MEIMATHPAIFMVEYALAQALMEKGIVPHYTFGTSLGSFAAACVSGCLAMEDALSLVVKHAAAFETTCEPGGLVAILAEPRIHETPALKERCVVAAVNFHSHFVVAAPIGELGTLEKSLHERSISFQRLPVAFAFHSPWIDAAKDACLAAGANIVGAEAKIPIICGARAEALNKLPRDYFWNVARAPIEFQHTVETLEATGSFDYVDVGPSATLATFLKYLLPSASKSTVRSIMSPYGGELDKFAAITSRK
jgi:acyl transferase domain-containing protein